MGIKEANTILYEKVFDAGANTIWSEMKKLRGKAPEEKDNMRRRWIWELVQNASDCVKKDGKVNIEVGLEKNILKFKHDGVPFTYENLLDLITQISSKQSSEEEKTGKFGTGFIATHLLSERVGIKSIFKQDDDKYKDLKFILDRSGGSYQEIREQIKLMLDEIEKIKNDDLITIGKPDQFETMFEYRIDSDKEKEEAVKAGLEDLKKAIPIVLAINTSIQSITCEGIKYEVINNEEKECVDFTIKTIQSSNNVRHDVMIMEQEEVAIMILVKKQKDEVYKVLPFDEDMPKLFCKFPLIGTEEYSFPVIINSANFEVKKDRDGIHEGDQENIKNINLAIELYSKLINRACDNMWCDLFNICKLSRKPLGEIQRKNNETIKQIYEVLNIVEVNRHEKADGRYPIKRYDNDNYIPAIGIPYAKKEYRDSFWEVINTLGYLTIPTKESYVQWHKVFQQDITIQLINERLLKNRDLLTFKEYFKGESCDVYSWLNQYYTFYINVEGKEKFISEVYVLNQTDNFIKVEDIYLDNQIDDELKEILNDLGEGIRKDLVNKKIRLTSDIIIKNRDNVYVAKQIENKVKRILSEETLSNKKRTEETQHIFNKITNWFMGNRDLSENIFESLYAKRNLLSTPEENLRRFKIAEKIESNNIGLEELDSIIESSKIVSEIIVNMDKLSGEDLSKQLKHIINHSKYAAEKFRAMMERSIANIYEELRSNNRYTISPTLDEWKKDRYFDSVFKAKREGEDIRIIIRPSDQNKIIFFSQEEIVALDDISYELWTDNGEGKIRMITLGDIIQTTGITVIPLRNIYA